MVGTHSVARYIAQEMQPFNTVEKPAFRQMLQTFDSQYKLPRRTYVSQKAILQLYIAWKTTYLRVRVIVFGCV